jgi:hypothetical protein
MLNNLQDYCLSGLGPIFFYSERKAALLGKLLCSILRRKWRRGGGGSPTWYLHFDHNAASCLHRPRATRWSRNRSFTIRKRRPTSWTTYVLFQFCLVIVTWTGNSQFKGLGNGHFFPPFNLSTPLLDERNSRFCRYALFPRHCIAVSNCVFITVGFFYLPYCMEIKGRMRVVVL